MTTLSTVGTNPACPITGWHRLIVVALLTHALLPAASLAAETEPFPLEPPDTSSPRATLESFMRYSSAGNEATRRGESVSSRIAWFERAERCLDLSKVSPDRAANVATEASLLLYEVLNRAGLPPWADIPGQAVVEERSLKAWTVPRTEITLHRVEQGERVGQFLFSPQTVVRALDSYERVKHLPHKTDYAPGSYAYFVLTPDWNIPHGWVLKLPSLAKLTVFRNPLWKWIGVVVTLVFGILIASLVRKLGHRWDRGVRGERRHAGSVLFTTSLAVIPLAIDYVLDNAIGVRFGAETILSKCLLTLSFLAAVLAVFAWLELIAEQIISSRRLRERSVNAHLVRVTARITGIVVSIFIVLEATAFLGLPLTPVLAGLGVGGLAVALAARPTIENVIGGFTLFADRPVRVGEFCAFDGESGTVEEIGLRSTRVRKLNDVVISIPNADFSQMQLKNYARIRNRLYQARLGLRYETTPQQLRYVLTRLREMLVAHPKVSARDLHTRFLGFGDYSLDIEVFAYIRTPQWLEYRAIREDINLRIMDIVKEAGTGFAFPSQTAYLSRDSGLDAERRRAVEQEVERWQTEGELPFPDLSVETRSETEDTLDYPPKGSPDYRPRKKDSDPTSSTG